MGVSTVQEERDTPLFQAHAQWTGVVISEPEVEDRCQETIALDEADCIDEDRATGKVGALHDISGARPSASAKGCRLLEDGGLSRAVDQSSMRNKRDDRPCEVKRI